MEGLVEPERIADANHRDARGAAEVRQHPTDGLMQLSLVDHFCLLSFSGAATVAISCQGLTNYLRHFSILIGYTTRSDFFQQMKFVKRG
jgi:hypothetical protein